MQPSTQQMLYSRVSVLIIKKRDTNLTFTELLSSEDCLRRCVFMCLYLLVLSRASTEVKLLQQRHLKNIRTLKVEVNFSLT